MELRNKKDGNVYDVNTEADLESFYILARAHDQRIKNANFFMHYRSLQEFTDDWEDID